jgi:hypothetical protein
MMTFAIPLAASVWAAVWLLTSERAVFWKLLAVGIVVAALAMQFIPAWRTHFLIPLLMQIAVAIWGLLDFYWPREI